MLGGKTFLITGIADRHSLAMYAARLIQENGGRVVCAGLGITPFHRNLSERATHFLQQSYADFEACVEQELGAHVLTAKLDVTLPESVAAFFDRMQSEHIAFDGLLHAIAMDKTIREKQVKPLLDVSLEEFCETMDVSAFSLITLINAMRRRSLLHGGASICSISYIAAEKVTFHPYRNISIAKAALERITVELADELGRQEGIRVNCIRFSPYMGSKAGNATLSQEDLNTADRISPLGNAQPQDLGHEVLHLFRPGSRITGEIRHVDGGYHIMG
jgi:enoyl-[acyl-carrier protein] reductase I